MTDREAVKDELLPRKGRAFLLKIKAPLGDEIGWQTVAGLREEASSLSADSVNITAAGIFLGGESAAAIRERALDGSVHDYRLSFEDGHQQEHALVVARLEALGTYNGEINYRLHLNTRPTPSPSATPSVDKLVEAREAFLNMIADARDWHCEPDGDETGDHTTFHLITHWRQLEDLCLALGIKEPGYMETWDDALTKAVSEPARTTLSQYAGEE